MAETTSETQLIQALLDVEAAWGHVLAEHRLASQASAEALAGIARSPEQVSSLNPQRLAAAAAGGGNPVIPLVAALRTELASRGADDSALHQGATSQDIMDTAMMLMVRRSAERALPDLDQAASALAETADAHRSTLCTAHSLAQHALPTVFGMKAAVWLDGITSASSSLRAAQAGLSLQWGGAVGTQAALTEIAGAGRAAQMTLRLGETLGLAVPALPWQVQRQSVLEIGSALAGVAAALGKAAGDVLTLQRPEVGELREPAAPGKGGSSAMPQKQNPSLSVLIRSAALSAPGHLSTLYQAAAAANDERPDGAWHAEWPAVRELLRLAGGAAARAAALFQGLEADAGRMTANLTAAGASLLSERLMLSLARQLPGGREQMQNLLRASLSEGVDLRAALLEELQESPSADADVQQLVESVDLALDPSGYLGRADDFIDAALAAHSRGGGDPA
ncbi:3-carboxy-cis,cis-muconate cycloisomerase [Nesterenkonia populi]